MIIIYFIIIIIFFFFQIFLRTFLSLQVLAHHIHILLTTFGVDSGELHGDLKQTDRVLTLKNFKDGKIDALVATDVAARGLDIAGVQTVSYNIYVA